jgi:hypothetical protein
MTIKRLVHQWQDRLDTHLGRWPHVGALRCLPLGADTGQPRRSGLRSAPSRRTETTKDVSGYISFRRRSNPRIGWSEVATLIANPIGGNNFARGGWQHRTRPGRDRK